MKRYVFLSVTAIKLLITVVVLARTGWLGSGSPRLALLKHDEDRETKTQDPFDSEAGLRYQRSMPAHWRACLLQR